ncbi:aldolase [Delitschia confertaspora ATCC 74209]|uniref:deoxyribose-phosphate aldolase n=1 Tax=Delitschia confertaspora ATCC 74209 TaxID=1513339 RepID=A0A9P4JPY9_9PLEO|nr:aldolase [Delitschia confertaspora ATCC 74209]
MPSTDPSQSSESHTPHPEIGNLLMMTDRYTNEEWAAQIAETQKKVVVNKDVVHPRPAIGSREFAETIDHTLLKLDATPSQIDALCSEARTEGFKSVCVRLPYVSRCVSNLKGSPVVVACVVGFHEGTHDTYSKLQEAKAAVDAGAAELDIVINHSILTQASQSQSSSGNATTTESLTASNTAANSKPFSGSPPPAIGPYSIPESDTTGEVIPDYSGIYKELASLRSLCPSPTVLKLILETSQLTPPQILACAHLAAAANFDFIKTSTGFNGRGASLEDIQLMSAAAQYLSTKTKSNDGSPVRARKMQVKASGGIRGLDDAVRMLEAGATRLGSSSGLWIMQESRERGGKESERRPGATRLYTDDSAY